ncbi:hypothetical protein PISMIDRAFT_18378 [Pisolithus microcarpus 441]|uniref:Uncharacterized protein n=1 Tax=Pisolithus microcarpus 441 TaxID=765257 RepID=A0A0C9XKS1_9AGAM|nr:hypothetical protein PISMIDRAFT_18378 [Pisolithus microcarpus 441]
MKSMPDNETKSKAYENNPLRRELGDLVCDSTLSRTWRTLTRVGRQEQHLTQSEKVEKEARCKGGPAKAALTMANDST